MVSRTLTRVGQTHTTISVRPLPSRLSFSRRVSTESRYGMCESPRLLEGLAGEEEERVSPGTAKLSPR